MGHLSVTAHDYLLTHGEKRERGRERKPHCCTDGEMGRKIGSEGASAVRVKGELGLEKRAQGVGGWEPHAIFFFS